MSDSEDARTDLPRARPALLIRIVGAPRRAFTAVQADRMEG
jgi:hypothetical protein